MTALVISGMGAVTSVGRTVLAASAAIRARISRPRKLGYFRVVDEETQAEVGLAGHPLKGYTEGFNLIGRWLRLAEGALEDLLEAPGSAATGDARFWARTGLVGVFPTVADLMPAADAEPAQLLDLTLRPLRESFGLGIPERQTGLVASGHVGLASALEQRLESLGTGELERLLVVAADSYLTPLPLRRLSQERRLKTDAQPVGLVPGEAGVCLLLERDVEARRRGVVPLARIVAATTGQETGPEPARRQFHGAALADCARRVISGSRVSGPFTGDFHVDLTGEPWRARHWGDVLTRLRPQLADSRIHLVASSVGDTGAASGALGLVLATHLQMSGHARSGLSLVVSTSEDGAVGCVGIEPVEGVMRSPWLRTKEMST